MDVLPDVLYIWQYAINSIIANQPTGIFSNAFMHHCMYDAIVRCKYYGALADVWHRIPMATPHVQLL